MYLWQKIGISLFGRGIGNCLSIQSHHLRSRARNPALSKSMDTGRNTKQNQWADRENQSASKGKLRAEIWSMSTPRNGRHQNENDRDLAPNHKFTPSRCLCLRCLADWTMTQSWVFFTYQRSLFPQVTPGEWYFPPLHTCYPILQSNNKNNKMCWFSLTAAVNRDLAHERTTLKWLPLWGL